MKVLLLIHKPQARGQEIFAAQLGQEFLDRGLDVLLVSLYPGNFPLSFSGAIQSLDLQSPKEVWNPFRWRKFAKLVSKFRPDIIQANGGDTLKFLGLSSFFLSKNIKLVFNNGGVMGYYLKHSLQKRLNAWFLKQMDGLVSVSEYSKSDLERFFFPRILHQVIPIGVKIPKRQTFLEPELTWVHVGGFTPEKNHAGLVALFQGALAKGVKGNLLLIGEGWLKQEVEKSVAKIGLQHRIKFLGNLPEPWAALPKNVVLLLPSLVEGMPAVIGEAFSLGIPVIGYRVGGIAELEREFSSLICISPGDSKDFIQAMIDLHNNPNPIFALSEQETEKAKTFFSLSRATEQYLNFYSKL